MYPGLAYSTAEKAIGTDYTGKIIYQRTFQGVLKGLSTEGGTIMSASFSIGQTVTSLWLDPRCYVKALIGKIWPVVGLAEENVFSDEGFNGKIQTRYSFQDPQVRVTPVNFPAGLAFVAFFTINYTKD
jgi:hypothetical protein